MTSQNLNNKRIAAAADRLLTNWEKFWYGVWCVISCGATFVTKIIIKKAVIEALIAHELANAQSVPGHGTEGSDL